MIWRVEEDSFFVAEAGSGVSRIQMDESGDLGPAGEHSFGASWLEGTACERQGRGIAGNYGQLRFAGIDGCIEIWGDGLEKRFCVGMARGGEKGFGWGAFDDAAAVEDQNAIGEPGEQGGIVGDEEHREAEFFLERSKDVEDFHLRTGVEGCRGLVGDDQGGTAGDGLGDEHALELAAAELMGIRVCDPAGAGRKEQRE